VRGIAPPKPLRVTTDWLMGGQREIVLEHRLQEYRLRITAAGKLILTK
jgi:hemin uptake protein HemP